MTVTCPYCENSLTLQKSLKPGKYTPSCPKCTRRLLILVPEEPGAKLKVAAIQSERQRQATRPGTPPPEPHPAGADQTTDISPDVSNDGEDRLRTDPASPSRAGRRAQAATAAAGGEGAGETVDLARTERPVTRPVSTAGDDDLGPRPSELDTAVAEAPHADLDARPGNLPGSLGGYQILKLLGQGGMGAVYLARQLSLDRNVALKTMKPTWASNATFVARFTREAYAAAQLTHHNVVQIYDFGEDQGTPFFSMEFVEGHTLSGVVREKDRLDAEEAAGYILQAARGLKFAHDQGMIHRDIKPDNLLLSRQGIVKVADLGLVKTPEVAEAEEADEDTARPVPVAGEGAPSAQITHANVAMGTPAFMSPEQARDAAHVDVRADIYSLGCTFYTLVTGRPPFDGRTAFEVISKHQTQPITPPEIIAKRVPKSVSAIILKMTAKKPEDRYPDLGSVIKELEAFLGLSSSGPFTPREEHATLLEQCVAEFNGAPAARLRDRVRPLLIVVPLALAIVLLIAGRTGLGVGMLSLGLAMALSDFVIGGFRRQGALFQKVRELAFSSSLSDWLFALAIFGIFAITSLIVGVFWYGLGFGLIGLAMAIGIQQTIDRKAEEQRREPRARVEEMLRSMRLQGLGEEPLRQFVCKYGGERWEEFYEALFGYEAKLSARERWGKADGARARPRHAGWRDPIIAWTETRLKSRREAREVAKLQKIEEKSLQSQGENLVTARRKARRSAEAMVATAGELKESIRRRRPMPADRSAGKALREAAKRPEKILVDRESGLYGERRSTFDSILGPRIRFLAGAALLGGCLAWMHQNGVLSRSQAQAIYEAAETAAKTGDLTVVQAKAKAELERSQEQSSRPATDLQLPVVPSPLLKLVSTYGAGVAGLILLFSSFFEGARMTLFAAPAAAVPLLGSQWLPAIGSLNPSLAPSVIGGAVMALGVLIGRKR